METTIKKKFTIDQIETLFDCDLINVKYFKIQEEINYEDPNQKFSYLVCIRHPEDMTASDILDTALEYVNTLIKAKRFLSYKEIEYPKNTDDIIHLAYELEQKDKTSLNSDFMNYLNHR